MQDLKVIPENKLITCCCILCCTSIKFAEPIPRSLTPARPPRAPKPKGVACTFDEACS